MLDTNTVSHLIKAHPAASRRLVSTSMAFLCVSIITKDELLFGLVKRPDAKRLHLVVRELLRLLRRNPQRLPEKVIRNRRAVLNLGLLSFAVFVGMQ